MLKIMRHKVYFDTILIHGQGDPLLPIIITDTSIIDIVSRTDPEEARCLCQCFCLCNSIHLICMLGWLQGVLYWAWSTVWQPVSVNGEKAFLFSLYLSVCACACACVCVWTYCLFEWLATAKKCIKRSLNVDISNTVIDVSDLANAWDLFVCWFLLCAMLILSFISLLWWVSQYIYLNEISHLYKFHLIGWKHNLNEWAWF